MFAILLDPSLSIKVFAIVNPKYDNPHRQYVKSPQIMNDVQITELLFEDHGAYSVIFDYTVKYYIYRPLQGPPRAMDKQTTQSVLKHVCTFIDAHMRKHVNIQYWIRSARKPDIEVLS